MKWLVILLLGRLISWLTRLQNRFVPVLPNKWSDEFVVRYYKNGANETIAPNGVRRIKYNTGDVVHIYDGKVIVLHTEDHLHWEVVEDDDYLYDLLKPLIFFTVHSGRPCNYYRG